MSTRSAIGYFTPEKTVRAVYCHWDGYPSNNGRILMEHYTHEDKIMTLVSLGDISSLGQNIGFKKDFYPADGRIHTETYFFGRDRSEKDVDPVEYADVLEYVEDMKSMNVEFVYLWHGSDWLGHAIHRQAWPGSADTILPDNGYPSFDFVEFVLAREDAEAA